MKTLGGKVLTYWLSLVPLMALIELVFALSDLINHQWLYVGGSFINSGPSACFLSCTVPLTIRTYRCSTNAIVKIVTTIIFIGYAIFIPLSLSRTAILALITALTIIYWQKIKLWICNGTRIKMLALATAAIVFGTALFLLKPESACGRLLIWKISFSLLQSIPWNGVGWNCIESVYNEAQELYFQVHPDATFEMNIAGSTSYIFNDFLSCIVAYGVYGGIAIISSFAVAMAVTLKFNQWELFASICSFAVVMFGSYPLHCFQFVVLSAVMWIGILPLIRRLLLTTVYSVLLVCLFYTLILQVSNKHYDRLFNTAITLNKECKYIESNKILLGDLKPYVADVRVLYLIGRNYQSIGQTDSAEYFYKKAIYRVPSRHYPHYLLMKLYRENRQDSLAYHEAVYLLEHQPKVYNQAVEEMRYAAAQYLHQLDLHSNE